MNEHTIAALVQAANNLLEAGEPGNISVDTYSGFTGYKPQFIIDAMNEAVGYGNWGFEEVSNEIVGDEKATLIVSQVRVFLKDCAFQPTGWGQARITKGDIGDAKKGAQTDAIKKALSYFSIGNRAYLGLLKEESQDNQNGNRSRTVRSATTARRTLPQGQQTAHPPYRAVYEAGVKRGAWTRETFYATASGILDGFPVNANNVKALSEAQLQKLQRDVERYQAQEAS